MGSRATHHSSSAAAEITLFHVTNDGNIQNIIDAGALTPGGNGAGISARDDNADRRRKFLEDSKDKVFVSAHWAGTVRYMDYLNRKGYEASGDAVVLKISIPLDIFKELFRGQMMKDETDKEEGTGAPRLGSYYFQKPIPINHKGTNIITIAVYDNNDSNNWEWLPLSDFEASKYRPYVPDLPGIKGNFGFDANRAVRESIFRAAGIPIPDENE